MLGYTDPLYILSNILVRWMIKYIEYKLNMSNKMNQYILKDLRWKRCLGDKRLYITRWGEKERERERVRECECE